MIMKKWLTWFQLYGVLCAVAVFFLFPFYWVLISSLKSRAGMNMTPPAFYPAEPRATELVLPAADRIVRAEGKEWFRLCASRNLLEGGRAPGGYYVELRGERASQFVAWLADAAAEAASNPPREVTFERVPIHGAADRAVPVVVAARMVRQVESGYDELLFVLPEGAAREAGTDFEILHNVAHEEIRDFAPRWENYPETLRGPEATIGAGASTGFLLFMRNSFFISILAVIGQIFSSSLVAYGFSRVEFRGRNLLFVLLLATMMVPAQVKLIPLFSIYKGLGWIDTFLPLIVPHFTAGAFNVFLMRQYMLTLPRELDDAAAIDGCNHWQIYRHVILPNCIPVLIVVGIFTFVYTWQDVMGPLIYLDNPDYRTVTLGLEYFRSPYVDNRHLLMTGAVLAMLPVAGLFLVFQRYIMSGIATTGLKG